MLDDGMHNDGDPMDNIYGCTAGPWPHGSTLSFGFIARDSLHQEMIAPWNFPFVPIKLEISDDFPEIALNEILINNQSYFPDEIWEFESLIELINWGQMSVELSNYYFSTDTFFPELWQLPDVVLNPGEFNVFWCDGDISQGKHHTNFALNNQNTTILLIDADGARIIDSYECSSSPANTSVGRCPDGIGQWEELFTPNPSKPNCPSPTLTPGTPTRTPSPAPTFIEPPMLYINEIMPSNYSTVPDNFKEFDDWIEIYNPNSYEVDLSGMYLSDDIEFPMKWQIKHGIVIQPNDFYIFWCDKHTGQGDNHANFRLSSNGERRCCYQSSEIHGCVIIDHVSFDAMNRDMSWGRYPDGSDYWCIRYRCQPR